MENLSPTRIRSWTVPLVVSYYTHSAILAPFKKKTVHKVQGADDSKTDIPPIESDRIIKFLLWLGLLARYLVLVLALSTGLNWLLGCTSASLIIYTSDHILKNPLIKSCNTETGVGQCVCVCMYVPANVRIYFPICNH